MKQNAAIRALFVDIGGVLGTNGWDHEGRRGAAEKFGFDYDAVEERHRLTFDTYERGKITLDEYLERAVFFEKRSFTPADFRRFMLAQSKAFPDMLGLVTGLKTKYGLKVVVVSNEGRELNAHRIRKFKLDEFVDCFVSSSFVGLRKPDPEILRLAIDLAQVPLKQIVYLENTPLFAEVAIKIGMRTILHSDYKSTRKELGAMGLR